MIGKFRAAFDYLLQVQADDPIQRNRGRLLALFLVLTPACMVVLISINLVQLAIAPSHESYVLADGLVALAMIGLWWLNHSGRVRLAIVIFLSICILVPPFLYGVRQMQLFVIAYAIPVIACNFLLAPASGVVIAALYSAGYSLLQALGMAGSGYDFFAMGVLWVITLFTTTIARQLNTALSAAQRTTALLRDDIAQREQAEAQLHTLNQQLEERIEKRTQALGRINIALQDELLERERAQVMLRNAEHRYRALFEQSHDAVFMLDFSGNHLEVNRRAADMLGYTTEEMLRLSMHEVSAEMSGSAAVMDRLMEGEDVQPYERWFRHKNGGLIPVEINVTLVRDVDGRPLHIQSVARDITRYKQAEAEMRLQRDLAVALGRVNDLPQAYEHVLGATCQTEGVDGGIIYYSIPGANELALSTHIGLPDEFVAAVAQAYEQQTESISLMLKGANVFVDAGTPVPPIEQARRQAGLRALALIPIQHEGRVAAGLLCASHTHDRIPASTQHTLEAITAQIGGVIARINAERALDAYQRNLQTLFDTLDDFLFIIDRDGCILHTNPIVQQRLGYTAEEMMQLRVLDVHPPARREEASAIIADMLAGRTSYCPVPLCTREGALIPVETRVVQGQWDNQPVLFGISRDVTERIRVMEALRDSENRSRALLNAIPDLMFVLSKDGTVLDYHTPDDNLVPIPSARMLGKKMRETAPPQVMGVFLPMISRAISTGEMQRREFTLAPWRPGAYFEARMALSGADDVLVIIRDITDRKRAEHQMRLQRDLAVSLSAATSLAEAAQLVLDTVCQVDGVDSGGLYRVNPDTSDLDLVASLGLSGDTVAAASHYPPDSPQARLVAAGQPVYLARDQLDALPLNTSQREGVRALAVLPVRHEGKGIAVLNCSTHAADSIPDPSRPLLETIAAQVSGVIARLKSESALRESREQLQRVVDGSSDGFWDWNLVTGEVIYSRRWVEMLGYQLDEMPPHVDAWEALLHPDDRPAVQAALDRHLAGRAAYYTAEQRLRTRDGGWKWILDRGRIYERNEAGRAVRMAGTHTDISQLKKAEEDVRRALDKEKELSELKSRFIANTSHEFRTPLTTILSSAELLEHYGERITIEKRGRYLHQIQASAKHMVKLMEDVMFLGRADSGRLPCHPAPIELAQYCANLVEELGTAAGRPDVSYTASGNCAPACLDEKLLRTILINLLSNAIKYSPGGAPVALEVDCHEDRAVFTVRDHGIGLSPEMFSRLFEPFQRGANVGSIPGTGLGMAIVKRSVDAHGGTIQFTSQPGEGTTFVVSLPFGPGVEPFAEAEAA